MTKLVIDAYAWISYLEGDDERVKNLIEDNNELYTNVVTVSETISKAKRKNMDTNIVYEVIGSLSNIFNIDIDFSNEVGLLHAELRRNIKDFGLTDTFLLLTAKKLNAKILTGDQHFKNFKEAILF